MTITNQNKPQLSFTHKIAGVHDGLLLQVDSGRLVGHGRLQGIDHPGQDLVRSYVGAERGFLVNVGQIDLGRGLGPAEQRPHPVLG